MSRAIIISDNGEGGPVGGALPPSEWAADYCGREGGSRGNVWFRRRDVPSHSTGFSTAQHAKQRKLVYV